ncbi:cation:proton antiporter [Streptosporangium sp. NPDC051023]|uniref:cation:proton antiporter n=1 Tax=Streptosporangium sp. NPDC051023 TaxID=3155410 RepID=UPI00344CDA6F
MFPANPEQFHLLDAVGQIGVLLLVGLTGIHMDMGLVRRRGATAAGVSVGGLIVPLGFGIGAGFLLPGTLIPNGTDTTVFALFMGVAMCVSAIPVIAKTLMDMKLLHRNIGQLTLTAGMIDDAFGWFMLSIVSAMAVNAVSTGTVLTSFAYLAAIVVFALTLGRPLVRTAMRLTDKSDEPGPTVATAAVLILLASAGTQALGLEAVFGAFVALGAGLNARGVIEVVVAMVGLRLGILSVEAYTIVVLVAIVTSLMAPPILRIAMARVEQTAEEELRESEHQAWTRQPVGGAEPIL